VPWQLESSEAAKKRARRGAEWNAPGAVRRGPAARPGGKSAAGLTADKDNERGQ
jgi:hypothetical protein